MRLMPIRAAAPLRRSATSRTCSSRWISTRHRPNLFLAAAQGDHFDKVTLVSRKVGGDALVDYVKVEMEGVFVSSFQMGASSGSEKAQLSGSLNFGKITFTYTPQKEDGTPDAEVVQGFDIKVGKKV